MTRKEIVKALRCFASEDNCPFDECNEKCPYWMEIDKYDIDNPNAEISDVHQLCCDAADMLEQDARGWISVKDKLPENEEPVLIATKWKSGDRHGIACSMAFHTDGKTFTGDSGFYWNWDGNDDLIYDENHDEWIVPEGWWEYVRYGEQFCVVDEPVVAWMHLPEPPKEEKA